MFLPDLRGEISQGDIFDGVRVTEPNVEAEGAEFVLLSHDCEFDKPSVDLVLVCRVYPLSGAKESLWGDIRAGRALNAMFLPSVGERPESFVNFRYIHRTLKVDLVEASTNGRRIVSMTDDGRAALASYLFRFIARRLP